MFDATDLKAIRRALLSVTDKTGLIPFAQILAAHGTELVSTGGTARILREAGIPVRDVADLTGFPEMLDGRVKTLHPKVHGGILHIRSNPEHLASIAEHAVEPIDMVVVNLYPFEATVRKPGVTFPEIIENIDIGGPSMVRSAAKNFEDVAIVTASADYEALAAELETTAGKLCRVTRWRLAQQAFATTAAYDTAISETLARLSPETSTPPVSIQEKFPRNLALTYARSSPLRYGENPHQQAAVYVDSSRAGVASARQLQGKELSFNNLVDLDACWTLITDLSAPTFVGTPAAVAIIKHTNPCGAAVASTVLEAYRQALAADPVSAFGGVIAINQPVDGPAADEIAKLFVEAIVAPSFTPEARDRFAAKKNLRLVEITPGAPVLALKQISGGLLLQDADILQISADNLENVTDRHPTPDELATLLFAWAVCKHVKSNAIVYARASSPTTFQTVGIGAGQMSRVDAARFGAMKATLPLAGSVAASDAFFPFPDGLEEVIAAGATAVIQPGGSVKDPDVIAAANRLGITMVYTGVRHFRHG